MSVLVEDVSIGDGSAYVVRPPDPTGSPLPGVLYLHWFEPPASNQNRGEFLAEAVDLVTSGAAAAAVLPQLTFPWAGKVHGDERDRASVEAQAMAVAAAYRTLAAQPGVDPDRISVVGHDYGAMQGLILAAREAVRAVVVMAPDATWGNWFAEYFLRMPAAERPAYAALFAGLDPVELVGDLGDRLYLQFAGQDRFVPEETRAVLTGAAPGAAVSLYEHADHFLAQPARDDRDGWLRKHL